MEFNEVVRERFSCKKFDSRQVAPEKLAAILEAGRLAPTAKNLQEQRIYVVQSDEVLATIDSLMPCRYGVEGTKPLAMHGQRKDISETVSYM